MVWLGFRGGARRAFVWPGQFIHIGTSMYTLHHSFRKPVSSRAGPAQISTVRDNL